MDASLESVANNAIATPQHVNVNQQQPTTQTPATGGTRSMSISAASTISTLTNSQDLRSAPVDLSSVRATSYLQMDNNNSLQKITTSRTKKMEINILMTTVPVAQHQTLISLPTAPKKFLDANFLVQNTKTIYKWAQKTIKQEVYWRRSTAFISNKDWMKASTSGAFHRTGSPHQRCKCR